MCFAASSFLVWAMLSSSNFCLANSAALWLAGARGIGFSIGREGKTGEEVAVDDELAWEAIEVSATRVEVDVSAPLFVNE